MSLYQDLQHCFKAEFAGRYLGLLLSETCKYDPSPFRKFFSSVWPRQFDTKGRLSLYTEHSFIVNGNRRRADLAVTVDSALAGLVELKFRDKLAPKTHDRPAQLDDYV